MVHKENNFNVETVCFHIITQFLSIWFNILKNIHFDSILTGFTEVLTSVSYMNLSCKSN